MEKINLLYIDLFCGAGGTSTGVEYARHDGKEEYETLKKEVIQRLREVLISK